jgi:hypothetical protein
LNGASGLLVHGEHVYVTGMFASTIQRFRLADGKLDPSFGVSGLAFPSGLTTAPDGNGFLVGILGVADGEGHIARYDFDGNLLGTFASHGNGGFVEGTAFIVVSGRRLIGEYNENGVIDAADYVAWRNAGSTDTLPNDGTPGVVDASDYAVWRSQFGRSAAGSSTAIGTNLVPEPGSVSLLLVAGAIGGMLSRRRDYKQSSTTWVLQPAWSVRRLRGCDFLQSRQVASTCSVGIAHHIDEIS